MKMKEYNFTQIWVSRIIDSKFPLRIKNPLLASIIKFGLLPNFIVILFVLMRQEYITDEFMLIYVFGLIWLNIGPYLIWYYDEKLLPNFFNDVTDILNDKKAKELAKKYDKLFSRIFKVCLIMLLPPIIIIWIYGSPSVLSGGILGYGDFWYWAWLVIVSWVIILASACFGGVIITILAIREVSNENLNIDPLHPDNLGGLGCVGHYAIMTTIIISSGSLYLPGLFQFTLTPETKLLSYLVAVMYSAFILISFLYPTVITNKKASLVRDEILNKLMKRYNKLNYEFDIRNQMNEDISEYKYKPVPDKVKDELKRIREEHSDYKNMHLYPFEIKILLKLGGSVLLPFVFPLLQNYIIVLII